MAFGWILAVSTLSLTAFHHALEKRPFTEVLQLLKFPF